MATRCNIQINDQNTEIWLYRHYDGYPECTGDELEEVLKDVKPESAGQLAELLVHNFPSDYEYTTGQHGDIEYLYQIYVGDFDVVMHTFYLPIGPDLNGNYTHNKKCVSTKTISR